MVGDKMVGPQKICFLTCCASEGLSDLLHLFGAHIVSIHNEAFGVLVQELLKGNIMALVKQVTGEA